MKQRNEQTVNKQNQFCSALLILFYSLTSPLHGFNGIVAALEHLRDEFGRKSVACFALHSPGHSMGYDPKTIQTDMSEEMYEAKLLTHHQNRLRSAARMMVNVHTQTQNQFLKATFNSNTHFLLDCLTVF